MEETPSELAKKYYKGNIGKSLTSCCAFFYKYSNGYFLMLDDNDAMIMKQGVSQAVKLFFKAILDPDAITQPIAVPTTILKQGSKSLEALASEEESGEVKRRKRVGPQKESQTVISFDKEKLKEGIFRMRANDRIVVEEEVPLNEALDLYYSMRDVETPILKERRQERLLSVLNPTYKLREARYQDDDEEAEDDELIGYEDDIKPRSRTERELEEFDPAVDEGDPNELPTSFIFDSSVVFLSNLTREEIDPAIWDRFTTCGIELDPLEFMKKLEEVLPNLGQIDSTISKVPQEQVEWSKKVVFVLLKAITEAWAINQPLMGVDIDIKKRSLTFRLAMELTNDLLRLGRNEILKNNMRGDLNNPVVRQKILAKCEKLVLQKAIRKVVFGE